MIRIPQPMRDAPAAEWNVYADALQEANDPRGVLIALDQAVRNGASPADRDAHIAEHRQALFGAAAEYEGAFRVDWLWCLPDAVEIRVKGADARTLVGAFLESPLANGVRSIALVGVATPSSEIDLTAGVALLFERLPDTVRSLAFVDERAANASMLASRDFDPGNNLVTFGSLEKLWSVRDLEEVRIEIADAHQLELGTIDAPNLQRFVLRSLRYGTGEDTPLSTVLGEARWPKLRSFELRLPEEFYANVIADEDAYVPAYHGNEDFEDRMDEAEDGENVNTTNWGQLAPLLENLKECPLERLALTSFDSSDSLLEVIEGAGLPRSLVELDFSDSSISSIAWFERNKAMLHTLKRLVLERTPISEADAKALRKLGPEVVHSVGGGASFRYVVGSE